VTIWHNGIDRRAAALMVSFQQDFGKAYLVSRIFFSAARAVRAISQAGLYP
jgi:hypothetical protein